MSTADFYYHTRQQAYLTFTFIYTTPLVACFIKSPSISGTLEKKHSLAECVRIALADRYWFPTKGLNWCKIHEMLI